MKVIDKVIEIEQKELGYTEQSDGWTKFGQWYADNIAHSQAFARADWCVMFQTWSMAMAGVDANSWPYTSPQGSACSYLDKWLSDHGYRTGADDMPRKGDIVLYSWFGDPDELDHVGLIYKVEGKDPDNALLYVREGNYGNKVADRQIYYRDWRVVKTFRLPAAEQEYFPELSFMLSRGSSGPAVEILQAALIYRGYNIFGGVDGYFGENTEKMLIQYQTDIEIEADGKAGTETFSHLMGVL